MARKGNFQCPHCRKRIIVSVPGRDPRKKPLKRDWGNVDWSKSTTQIADELNMHIQNVSHARREYAPETVQPRMPRTGK
jgi:hypothetical protein